MRVQRRTNPLWGLVILALAGVWLARTLGYIPDGIFDALLRAWPGLLVLAGLSFIMRNRVPLGGLVALIASGILIFGVASAAFNTRATQQRTDFRQPIEQVLPADLILLRLRVEGQATDVEFLRALDSVPRVTGEFVGSSESRVEISFETAEDNSATLTLRETQADVFPNLEAVGRGTLRVELPNDLPLDIDFVGGEGDVTLNLSGLLLERLNVSVARGDLLVTLPEYRPLFSEPGAQVGTLTTRGGDLALFVPQAVSARLELNRENSGIAPEYDGTVYNYLVGDVLEARNIETAPIVVSYVLNVPRGLIRVETPLN
jgi:hypothetical protein